jgi:hypothetical protein
MFHEAVTWNLIGKDKDSSVDVIDRLRATLDRLPEWMVTRSRATFGSDERGHVRRQDKADAVTQLGFGLSRIFALTSTPKKAQGRSGKANLDDFGSQEEQQRKWQLLYPTLDDPDPAARGSVIITFNGEGENFAYHLFQKAKSGEVPLIPHFYWWGKDPRRLENSFVIDGDNKINADKLTEDEYIEAFMAGKIECPWYTNALNAYLIENPEADIFSFKAQYPTTEREAFTLRGNSRFLMATLNEWSNIIGKKRETAILAGKKYPVTGFMAIPEDTPLFEAHPTGRVRLYEKPEKDGVYILSVDAAGGRQAGDFCVAMVGRVHDDGLVEQVCVYEAKVEPQIELAHNALLLARWYNEALIIPETGSSGHGSSFVGAIKDEYDNIYREMRVTRFLDEEREELGFSTNRSSRGPLIDALAAALGRYAEGAWESEPTIIINDPRTLDQLHKFEIDANTGKAQAPKGSNDDLVVTTALLLVGAKSIYVQKSEKRVRVFSPNEW